MADRITTDLYVDGSLQARTLVPSSGCVTNAHVAAAAAIAASKLIHQHRQVYSQPNTTATTETRMLHVVYGATGTVIDFRAGSIVACIGAATITIDLKKNGATILSAVITLDNANAARVAEAGTISGPNLVAGDVLECVITATAGGGTLGTGLFVSLTVEEAGV